MPIPACCIKAKFYAKSALLYSKGGLYASDVGIKLPHVYDFNSIRPQCGYSSGKPFP